jgi:hypothetical protein
MTVTSEKSYPEFHAEHAKTAEKIRSEKSQSILRLSRAVPFCGCHRFGETLKEIRDSGHFNCNSLN